MWYRRLKGQPIWHPGILSRFPSLSGGNCTAIEDNYDNEAVYKNISGVVYIE